MVLVKSHSQFLREIPGGILQDSSIDISAGQFYGKQACGMVLGMIPTFFVWRWILATLTEFSVPGTEAGKPLGSVTGACLQEYNLLYYQLGMSIIFTTGNWLLLVLIMTKPCGGVLVEIVKKTEGILYVGLQVISLIGLVITAFPSDPKILHTCEHLHYVSWWIFTGFSLVALGFCCSLLGCGLCLMGVGGALGSRALEPQSTVSVQDAIEYEKMPEETSPA